MTPGKWDAIAIAKHEGWPRDGGLEAMIEAALIGIEESIELSRQPKPQNRQAVVSDTFHKLRS